MCVCLWCLAHQQQREDSAYVAQDVSIPYGELFFRHSVAYRRHRSKLNELTHRVSDLLHLRTFVYEVNTPQPPWPHLINDGLK